MEKWEKRHGLIKQGWWFKAKQRLLRQALKELGNEGRSLILDVGCGVGAGMDDASDFGTVFGFDIEKEKLAYCSRRHSGRVALADAASIPFKGKSFDSALCMNVIYHELVKDDKAVLSEISRVLKRQGSLVLIESASDSMKRTGIERRYTVPGLQAMLEEAGFSVKKISHWNMALSPLALLFRKGARSLNSGGKTADSIEYSVKSGARPFGQALYGWLLLENWVMGKIGLPFGTSIFCIAEKVGGK